MSAIEDVIAALESAISELSDAGNATGSAHTEVDGAVAQAAALGAMHVVAGLTAVKESIAGLNQQIHAAAETANEAISGAKAIAAGS